MQRFLLFLLIPLGLAIGAGLGLYLAWGPLAGAAVGASPAALTREQKVEYIYMVASAYADERDLRRARDRLDALDAGLPAQWVAELARADAAAGQAERAARLAQLATALGITDPGIVALAELPVSAPSRWQRAEERSLRCDETGGGPMLWVRLVDNNDRPLPGIPLQVSGVNEQGVASRTDTAGELRAQIPPPWLLLFEDGTQLRIEGAGLVECEGGDARALAGRMLILRRLGP